MLVFLREPMGYTQLDGHRVYGRKYAYGSFGPTDLPTDLYKKHKDILEDAKYTKVWLDNKFKQNFPDIAFTASDLYRMDFEAMVDIARKMGIKYVWTTNKKPTTKERHALRRSIIAFLNS